MIVDLSEHVYAIEYYVAKFITEKRQLNKLIIIEIKMRDYNYFKQYMQYIYEKYIKKII